MFQSKLFTKTRKEAPSDEESKNAKLLIRAGFIHKEMAGVYSFLPLGFRVLEKVNNIIREEMDTIGGQEVLLSAFQDKAVWEKTDRWDDEVVDNWFKTSLKNGGELGLGFTHEEPLTVLMKNHISSYRDLPRYAYQIQTKFRNELRAKSGIMRGREFLMKDMYSFSRDVEEHNVFYEKAKEAYLKVFERVGLGDLTYITFASGGSFSQFSHEFQTITEAGEDLIYIDEEKKMAVNKEVLSDEVLKDLGMSKENLVEKKAVEVGNIFTLGTRFSEALGLNYKDEEGKESPVFMGSYGIGPARLIGTAVEMHNDERGIKWPVGIAPFLVHIILLPGSDEAKAQADELYKDLESEGVEVLYDDRDKGAGEKLADSDLIGIPLRVLVSQKSLEAGGVEVKKRWEEEAVVMKVEEAKKIIAELQIRP